MEGEALRRALGLAGKIRTIYVATAGSDGWPHLAAAGRIEQGPDDRIRVSAWFCAGTVLNLAGNPRISLVVWDPASDQGYQLVGEVEHMQELSMLNGYHPAEEGRPVPQVERELLVRVRQVLRFTRAPHEDLPEE
jgi:hypothetical protein